MSDGVLAFERRSGIALVTRYAILLVVSGLLAIHVALYLRCFDVVKHVGIEVMSCIMSRTRFTTSPPPVSHAH